MSATDEDTELRDLVAQTLEENGSFPKIRAMLMNNVFLALQEQEEVQNINYSNEKLISFLSTEDGTLMANLVREFLEFFDLDFTLEVFKPEASLDGESPEPDDLAKKLNLKSWPSEGKAKVPLLMEVLRGYRSGGSTHKVSSCPSVKSSSHISQQDGVASNNSHSCPKSLTEMQIEDARKKFNDYDTDESGTLEKDELRELFMDMFPAFNKNMLDRYVNDEFQAVDKDFSSSIDFDEFLGMYKRLFLQCRTVVSGDVEDILSMKGGPSVNLIQAKNQRNTEKSAPPLPSTPPPSNAIPRNSTHINSVNDVLAADDDSFFDVMPPTDGLHAFGHSDSDKGKEKEGGGGDTVSGAGKAGDRGTGSSMTSLGDLPFLTSGALTSTPNNKSQGSRSKDEDSNLRSLDPRMAGLGIENDMQDDFEYEDDFQSSGHSLSLKSPRSKNEGRDKTENGSIAEEIDEEEIEDFSIDADDLLKSENSGCDDMTEDRSISQMDGGFDYMEDPQQ